MTFAINLKRDEMVTRSSKRKSPTSNRQDSPEHNNLHPVTEITNSIPRISFQLRMRYECDMCDKTFRTKRGVLSHWTSRAHFVSNNCRKCGEPMPELTGRKKIRRQCEKCVERFEINRIKKSFLSHQSLVCEICGKAFTSKIGLKKHQVVVHDRYKQFVCELCGKTFAKQRHMDEHKLSQCSEKPFQCSICYKSFGEKRNRDQHESRHKENDRYHCAHCNRQYRHKKFLYYHMQTHMYGLKPLNELKCTICSESFDSEDNLKNHQLVRHSETHYKFLISEKRFEDITCKDDRLGCAFCNKRFIQKNDLADHMQTEHSDAPPPIDSSKVNLPLMPKKLAERRNKHLSCDICGQLYSTGTALKRHKQIVHEGLVPYQCDKCDRRFSRKDQLARHFVVHSSVKAFKCSICQHAFKRRRNQLQHEKAVHGQIAYSCTLCGIQLSRKYNFVRHMQKKHQSTLNEPLMPPEENNSLVRKDDSVEDHLSVSNETSQCGKNDNYRTDSVKWNTFEDESRSPDVADDPPEQRESSNHPPAEPEPKISTMYISHQAEFVSFVYNSLQQHRIPNHFIAECSKPATPEIPWNSSADPDDSFEQLEALDEIVESEAEVEVEWLSPACLYRPSIEPEITVRTVPDSSNAESKININQDQFLSFVQNSAKRNGTPNYSATKISKSKTVRKQKPFPTSANNSIENPLQPFRCDMCDRSYKTKDNLNRHKRTSHVTEKPFVCQSCGKAYGVKSDLTRHERTHSSDRPYICKICGNGFKRIGNLRDHEIAMHDARTRFCCEICGEKFHRKEKLTFHLQTDHFPESEKPFTCKICGRSFAFQRILRDHLLVHAPEKPFQCPQCDLSFKSANRRRKHVRTVHEDRPHFYCAYCNKSCGFKKRLSDHIQMHHSYSV